LAGREGEAPDGTSARREAHLRILPEIADQHHPVHRHCPRPPRATIGGPSAESNASRSDCCRAVHCVDFGRPPPLFSSDNANIRGVERGGEVGKPALILLSILKLAAVALDTAVVAPLSVAAAAVYDQKTAYLLCRQWARLNLALFGVHLRVRPLSPPHPPAPYGFLSHHRRQTHNLPAVAPLHDFPLP